MITMKRVGSIALVAVLSTFSGAATPQETPAEGSLELVWTCPLHREVTEAAPGECHICGRGLIETLVQEAYSCPIHSVISEAEPGQCPICDRDLYLVTEEVTYACPMHPEVRGVEPGTCHICHMALEPSTSTRPHQDHNPKHGGIFFMAPDNWHHLEGAYPEQGLFRVYVYDNFSQPMSAKEFKGRAVLKEVYDRKTRQTRELVAYPLLASEDGAYLEAHVGSSELPREVTAKIQFGKDGPFERFDFIFADLSVDAEVPSSAEATPVGLVIPERPADIASAIAERNSMVRDLVTKGAYNEIYVPALEAKDLALALETHLETVPAEQRGTLEWALKELVRSAWLLDDYGDLGNREKVYDAYDLFDRAVEEIRTVY